MGKLVIGPIDKGLRTDRTAFNIDNDSFPTLINAYQWRGRIKRKRGTSFLCRLTRFLGTTDGSGNLTVTILPIPIGVGLITVVIGIDIFVDPGGASPVTLLTNSAGSAILDRSTGILTITGSQLTTGVFYYPTLPVMGLEDINLSASQFPGTMGFDTDYSYIIQTIFPYLPYDVSFYKNPTASSFLPSYVPKSTPTPTSWNGQDYQQFWTTNYAGALWATNGINVPFSITNIGMQYGLITGASVVGAGTPPAVVTFLIAGSPLVIGDFVFVNEIEGMTGINWQTGYVISVVAGVSVNVEFPNATIGGAWSSRGILQYLTNRSSTTQDCLRFYDGDPTNGSATAPAPAQGHGWVNFAPPLSLSNYSIAESPEDVYYLVGARLIIPFKDRILFFGPVIQTSAAGSQIYLQDTIIYSQNGTPYYTVSYTNSPTSTIDNPTSPTNVYNSILVPTNETATPSAYFEDQTGFGGFVSAAISQPLTTAGPNEDVLMVGFSYTQTKLVYSGNDIIPFYFFLANSELGSGSTFSTVIMDKGVITRGNRGYVLSNQTGSTRIDVPIPDQVFEIALINNGNERFCSQRDFINEWVYFTYPSNQINQTTNKFPNQTLQYNYRDDSWAIFNESYTTYGTFRKVTGFTWATVGTVYPSWSAWTTPWNAGASSVLEPEVIGGNQQGFVIVRDDGTGEGISLTIQNFIASTVISPNHNLNNGDYIIISGVLGTIGAQVNNQIFSVVNPTATSFLLNPSITSGTYEGGGVITRMYVPFIQTKQFPVAWDMARKTRIGVQQYLLSTTANSQITLQLFLSQNSATPFNIGPLVPSGGSLNQSLIYSTILYTCPESTNLGLTPFNSNLQMPIPTGQEQTWHRMNTSLIGDTVQLGFTLSDAQMRSLTPGATTYTITGITLGYPTILTVANVLGANQLIQIQGVVGTTQLNYIGYNNYSIISATTTTVTINVDSSAFGAYVSGGSLTVVAPINQFAEIELHSAVLEVMPSQLLA